jgi:BirA family biotin operon repressor/biotin-[acetyl-CoA-carboxylase] ligase
VGSGGRLAEELAQRLATRWLGRPGIHGVDTVGSTNDLAAELARAGGGHGTVVLAEAQTRGRGRQGRRWYSPPGANLYLSVLLRPEVLAAAAPPMTLAAGVAVAEAIAQQGAAPELKWPNDVLLDGKKVAGILTEMTSSAGRVEAVVIGIGVDVAAIDLPQELAAVATSIESVLGRSVARVEVALALLSRLERWLDVAVAEGASPVAAGWRRWSRVGRRVVVGESTAAVCGVVESLDDSGALMVRGDDGRLHRIISGAVAYGASVAPGP